MRRGYATQGAVQPGPVFMEDAKGNKYDAAGNIVPPAQDPVTNALSVSRREVVDPYAEEIASAKKLMADKAYQEQSWGDWASNAGKNLYETGMSFLPTALGGRGEVGLTDIAKGVYESAKSGVTLPGDVLSGRTKVFDPRSGDVSEEVLRRGADLTGMLTLGAGAIPAEANSLRMGIKGATPSPEDAALQAAQEAAGDDPVAAATLAAQLEALNPVPPPQGIAPPTNALQTERGARTVIAPTSIKLTPQEQAVVKSFQSRADRAVVASRIRETKARYPKSDGWAPFEAVSAEFDDKGNPVINWKEQSYGFNTAVQPGNRTVTDPVTGEKSTIQVNEPRGLRPGTPQYEAQARKATRNGVKEVEDIIRRAGEGDENALRIIRQAGWYREFMRKGFDERGGSYPAFSDLLGATSPNTAVDQNYRYSVDLQDRFARGDFDEQTAFARDYQGSLNEFPEDKLIYRDPVGPKGPQKLQYGMNSRNAQMALADKWRTKEPGQAPKARNFSGNLGGATDQATIDVWAARFINRAAGRKRLPPPVESGVKGKLGSNMEPTGEFGFGQDVFRRITDELNRKGNLLPYLQELGYDSLTPMDMQALTWFIEKERWTKNNWTTAAGEGGSFEDELLKYPSERWQSGVSIQQADPPSDAAMASTRNVFENSLRDDPNVNQYRVHPTIGRYAGSNERSFDLELTAKPGWNPRTWMAAVIREAQANNQYDVFFSKRLSPELAQTNLNARPGVEIYFRDRKTLDQALPILEEFTKRNADGFTFVTDLRLRERELGGKEAPDFVGVRMQWVPEIRSRWDEDFRNAVEADPAVLDSTADEALDAMQSALLALDKAGLGIVDARVHHYDTLTVGKESYDKFLDGITDPENAAGAYEGRTGAAVDPVRRFGQPLYSHVEGRNRALRAGSEGGQSNASGDVVGAGQPSGALERAQQQGFTTEAYRGSNRDIQEYGLRASESGYYGGKPTYFTSSPEDATGYTRVPLEEYEVSPYDQLKVLQETNPEATLQDVLSGKYPNLAEEYANRLAGGENLGAVYPSKLKMQNPVRVGGEGETVFKGEEAANLVKITANTLVEAGIPQETVLPILSKLDDMLQSGGFGAMDFDLAIRNAAKGVDRRLAAKIGSILTDVYQKAGFDSIDLDASVFSDRRAGSYSYPAPKGSRHYMVFDPENIRGRFAKFGGYGPEGPAYMKAMGGAVDDEDIDNALRLARAMGGRIGYAGAGSVPIMMEDAKGNKYDAQGNIIPPTNPGPNPQRSDVDMTKTYQALSTAEPQGGMEKTYRALAASDMPENVDLPRPLYSDEAAQKSDAGASRRELTDLEYWNSLPSEQKETLIAQYPELREEMRLANDVGYYKSSQRAKASQPYNTQSMTHDAPIPRTEMKINMPLFGGEYSMGTAPYDVAEGLQGMAQGAYDFKTMPAYFFPPTAPFALGADVLESRLADDPLGVALNAALTPQGASAAKSAIGAIRRNPKATAAAIGTGAYFLPDEAEAGPARWFSKAMEVARAIPMEKMTGQQALAMLRKGVSPEELRWTGADVFLSTTPKVSKEELLDYLKNNRFQTEDVTLGGIKPTKREDVKPTPTASAPYMEEWNRLMAEDEKLNADFDLSAADKSVQGMEDFWKRQFEIDEQVDELRSKMIDATIAEMGGLGLPVQYGPGSRFGDQYVTRGGEGYGEDLYKMPNAMKLYNSYVKQLRKKYGNGALGDMPLTVSERGTLDNLMEAGGDERKVYTSGHFPQYPGYLAHSRSQTLNVEPPGANRPYKAWNVEEAQSDLAKSGRKSGFYDPVVYQKWANERYKNEQAIDEADAQLDIAVERASDNNDPYVVEARKKLNDAIAKRIELDAAMPNTMAAPIGPFVKSMEGWSKLTVKKQLDKALDSGADYFTWTPGEAQAQRYSLSKVADRVTYNPPFVSPSGKEYAGRIVATKNGSSVFEKSGVTPEKLPEFIGEELASKLLKNKEVIEDGKFKGLERYSVYGDELKFGGEGMRKYYDSAFVKYVQDVFKEATGEKPNIEVITAQTADGPRQQLGIRLTDEMREKARFSDFNKGGRVPNPAVNKALRLTANM